MYRYTAGKMDWFASGLPREGTMAAHATAGDVARPDVPTCGLRERVADVARRTEAAGWDVCVVLDDDAVVLGLLASDALRADATTIAEDAMREAPSTYRPHVALEKIVEALEGRSRASVLITTSAGRLVGLLRRQDAEETAQRTRRRREARSRSN